MPTITVSTFVLRAKARLIRTLLEENKREHLQVWNQMSAEVSLLPRDLRASHALANNPWHGAVQEFYDNYVQLATAMEAAADAYDNGETEIQFSFNPLA